MVPWNGHRTHTGIRWRNSLKHSITFCKVERWQTDPLYRGRGFYPPNATQPCVGSRIRTTVAVRLPRDSKPYDELVLPSPGCPRLQRYRRLVPYSGGIGHKYSITLHQQLIWWCSGVAAPFLGHAWWVACPWVSDRSRNCRWNGLQLIHVRTRSYTSKEKREPLNIWLRKLPC